MTLNDWSASLAGIASATGNHLWQSTIFLVAAGLLTLSLRKNPARVRYWVWLAASVKFLIPFSLLIIVGGFLSRGSARTNAGFYHAIDAVGQPFPLPLIPETSGAYPATVLPRATPLVPILLTVWLCGFLVVAFLWLVRWRRISATVRKATPLRDGREVEALRRLERIAEPRKRVEILFSRASLEPGIFGIARPVLLWPQGLSERLDDAHLKAILAHELWHVRRRDNLAAAIHMLVEATFWFHPLVWWLGARLVEERERACDEEVLKMGSDRQVYAESILKICEFCAESPLACVSGVTGSDLKKRMVYIMTENISRNLDFGRKLLLGAAGLAAVVVPIAFGLIKPTGGRAESQAQEPLPPVPAFESTMIRPNNGEPMAGFSIKGKPFTAVLSKPDRFMATNVTLHGLIRVAYGVQDSQIVGGPDWLNSAKYDVDATIGSSLVDQLSKVSKEEAGLERGRILQAFLADRFKLTLHRETREVPGYALVIANGGPKFQQAKAGDAYPNGAKDPEGRSIGGGNFETGPCKSAGQGVPIAALVFDLAQKMNSVVMDETNLKGNYDFKLDCHTAFMERGDSLLTVLPEQLGLELSPRTIPMEMLVIDHAEKPSGN